VAYQLCGKLGAPIGDRLARAGDTFASAIRRYLVRQKARLRPRSFTETERYLLSHREVLHPLPLANINRRAIASRLSEVATASGPAAADRARGELLAFFTWAMKEGLVEANPALATNTHRIIKARDRVLSDAELAEVWRAAGDDAYGTIIRLLILTGQRREEISALRWSEIDFPAQMIRLPAERTTASARSTPRSWCGSLARRCST
jgi:integrase